MQKFIENFIVTAIIINFLSWVFYNVFRVIINNPYENDVWGLIAVGGIVILIIGFIFNLFKTISYFENFKSNF